MAREEGRDRGGLDGQAVLLAAGLADLAVSTLGSALGTALGTARGLLRRSDTAELVAEAEQDLVARGRLVLDRYAAVPPAHLEVLAQHSRHARRAEPEPPARPAPPAGAVPPARPARDTGGAGRAQGAARPRPAGGARPARPARGSGDEG